MKRCYFHNASNCQLCTPAPVSAPTRECLGCKGSGVGILALLDKLSDCPICLGSGRVEAKPGVRDAVCDAETLRNFGSTHLDGRSPVRQAFALWSSFGSAVDFDPKQAQRAFRFRARKCFQAVPGLRAEATWAKTLIALTAFRAVPGLRGK